MKKINHINIKKGMKVSELINEFSKLGLQAGKLSRAVDVLEEMIKDKECKVFFGVAGALVPGGMRNILIDMLKNKYVDVFVTTGATLTHDLIEALGFKHYKGSEKEDDVKLHKKGLDRIYDVYMPNKAYEKLEVFFNKNFDKLNKAKNIRGFTEVLGKISPNNSILNMAYKNKIPVFCPAVADSGIGLMVWNNLVKGKKININTFDDLKDILDMAWSARKTGVFYLGGGVPKNYIQQAMQFSKGASYGLQVTTSRAEFGGSSGAELKEGISWGKLKPKAKFVDLRLDASVALPLIYSSLKDRLR